MAKKIRLQVTVGEDLFNNLKSKADVIGTSVQSLLVFYATEYMRQSQMLDQLPDMMSAASKLQDSLNLTNSLVNVQQLKNSLDKPKD